jgi:hypothetical protein
VTSNRVKAAARSLQTTDGIPYAEARRRVLDHTPPLNPTPRAPAPPAHRCFDWLVLGSEGARNHFCRRCASPELQDRVAVVDRAARDIRIVPRADGPSSDPWHGLGWPYGPNIDLESREALVEWAGPIGLRASSTRRKCVHWLLGKPCPRSSYGVCDWTVPGADHVSVWNRGAGRSPAVIVSQPYGLTDEDRTALGALDRDPDLVVEVDDEGGWYGFNTTFVGIWRADRHPASTGY